VPVDGAKLCRKKKAALGRGLVLDWWQTPLGFGENIVGRLPGCVETRMMVG
jgi:hypothetical protein